MDDEDRLLVVCDYVRLLGRVNISPDDIGDCVLKQGDKLIGNGFFSGAKALQVADYDPSTCDWAVTSPSLQPFQKGDSGALIMRVNEDSVKVGDDTAVDAVCLLSRGDDPITVGGENFGHRIDISQKYMKYSQVSQMSIAPIAMPQSISLKKEKDVLELAPIRGVPIEKLPPDTTIIPPWSVQESDVPLDQRILKVKGMVPIDKLPPDTHIVTPALTPKAAFFNISGRNV